jgi:sugar/nucleoside kinase (ribokinase family)
MTPEIVLIGHLAQDEQPDGSFRLGGTVVYAALLAARHSLHVGIVTSAREADIAELRLLSPDLGIALTPAPTPTIFANTYHDGRRTQYLRARAAPLTIDAIPEAWRAVPITLLGPIANEIDPAIGAILTGKLRAATPQGWLRAWDDTGRVTPIPWASAEAILPHLTALALSVEDLTIAAGAADTAELVARWARQTSLVALTDGPRGARLWTDGADRGIIPAFPVAEVDPTGAGDCFAMALLIALLQTGDPLFAMRYAHAAASFVVQAPGASGIPTPEQIRGRIN